MQIPGAGRAGAAAGALWLLAACGEPTGPGELGPLAAHYTLDGHARDVSGNGHDGTVFGAEPTTDRSGRPGRACAFDGVDDFIDTGTTFDFAPRTVAFWFRLREHLGRYQRILVQNSHLLEYGAFGVGITADSLLEGRAGGNGTFFIGEAKVVADRWYHMALVRNDSLEIYFVDGQVVDTSMASSGGSIWDRTVLILGATRIPDRFFAGAIDDVRIYEAALTADQVELLYRNSPT